MMKIKPFVFSIPGKVFILGEYAVLGGFPAIVAAVGPRFELKIAEDSTENFHPKSPASKLITWGAQHGMPQVGFRFFDPHHGGGGFGASTAQFAMVFAALSVSRGSETPDWKAAWRLYRELNENQDVPPSGADLVAQWQGGVVKFSREEMTCQDLLGNTPWPDILVFSATNQKSRKVPTHDHLSQFTTQTGLYSELTALTEEGVQAFQKRDSIRLGQAMDAYGDLLSNYNLQIEATQADRLSLRKLPGVCGVKGMGALQADGILVVLEPGAGKSRVLEEANLRGLKLIADGLSPEQGIRKE